MSAGCVVIPLPSDDLGHERFIARTSDGSTAFRSGVLAESPSRDFSFCASRDGCMQSSAPWYVKMALRWRNVLRYSGITGGVGAGGASLDSMIACLVARQVPFMIDSSKFHIVETGMKWVQGKSIINSISLKVKTGQRLG